MPLIPFHLRYTLNRSQRLVPHLRFWGVAYTPFIVALFTFFCVQAIVSACSLNWGGFAGFGGLALGLFVLLRGLFVGLLDVLLVPVRSMDVLVEENAAGIMMGRERWYLFLDGILDIRKYRDDTWTVRHFNGAVFHFAAAAISEDQLGHLRAAMERGRTPEGIRAVIERGKRLNALE